MHQTRNVSMRSLINHMHKSISDQKKKEKQPQRFLEENIPPPSLQPYQSSSFGKTQPQQVLQISRQSQSSSNMGKPAVPTIRRPVSIPSFNVDHQRHMITKSNSEANLHDHKSSRPVPQLDETFYRLKKPINGGDGNSHTQIQTPHLIREKPQYQAGNRIKTN